MKEMELNLNELEQVNGGEIYCYNNAVVTCGIFADFDFPENEFCVYEAKSDPYLFRLPCPLMAELPGVMDPYPIPNIQ